MDSTISWPEFRGQGQSLKCVVLVSASTSVSQVCGSTPFGNVPSCARPAYMLCFDYSSKPAAQGNQVDQVARHNYLKRRKIADVWIGLSDPGVASFRFGKEDTEAFVDAHQ